MRRGPGPWTRRCRPGRGGACRSRPRGRPGRRPPDRPRRATARTRFDPRTRSAGPEAVSCRRLSLPAAGWENHCMAGQFYVGTSGFAFPEWKHGIFYPEGLKEREMLSYYAGRFRSVEINYTFRRHPAEKTLLTWRDQTPDGFVFVIKANQRITHTLRLTQP